jgi:hypothetical protein
MSNLSNADQARMLQVQHGFNLSLLEARYLDFILGGTLAKVEFKDSTSKELEEMIKSLHHRLHEFTFRYSPNTDGPTSSSFRENEELG